MLIEGMHPHQFVYDCDADSELIVVGDAPCAADEFDQALDVMPHAEVMCINNASNRIKWHPPQLVATLHGGKKDFIGTDRMPTELMHDALLIVPNMSGWEHPRHNMILDAQPNNGTSAMFGVLAAVWLGYGKILVAGCPLTHYQYGTSTTLSTWIAWAPWLHHRVDAVSGNIKRIMESARANGGVPTVTAGELIEKYRTGHGE